MLRTLLAACTCLSLFGCVGVQVDRLPKETMFRDIQKAIDISGVFKNLGSSHSGEWHPLLSDVLFPGISFSEAPAEIRFGSEAPSALRCEALSYGKVLAVRILLQGEDFRLVDGGVQIDRKLAEQLFSEAGAGVGTESSVIRLTDRGDAVLTFKGGAVGLMLFIVPTAVTKAQDALFERMESGEPSAAGGPGTAGASPGH